MADAPVRNETDVGFDRAHNECDGAHCSAEPSCGLPLPGKPPPARPRPQCGLELRSPQRYVSQPPSVMPKWRSYTLEPAAPTISRNNRSLITSRHGHTHGLAKFIVGWGSHLYYWIYPGVMVGVIGVISGYLVGTSGRPS